MSVQPKKDSPPASDGRSGGRLRSMLTTDKGIFRSIVLPVLLAIWLYPPFARHWQDLPKEKEFKSRLVVTVTESMTDALSVGRVLSADLLTMPRQVRRDFDLLRQMKDVVVNLRSKVDVLRATRLSRRAIQAVVVPLNRAEVALLHLQFADDRSRYEVDVLLDTASAELRSALVASKAYPSTEKLLKEPLEQHLAYASSLASEFSNNLQASQAEEVERFNQVREDLVAVTASIDATLRTYYSDDVVARAAEVFDATLAYLRLSMGLEPPDAAQEIKKLKMVIGDGGLSWEALEGDLTDDFMKAYGQVREEMSFEMSGLVEMLVEEDTTVFTVGTCDVVVDLVPFLSRDHLESIPGSVCNSDM